MRDFDEEIPNQQVIFKLWPKFNMRPVWTSGYDFKMFLDPQSPKILYGCYSLTRARMQSSSDQQDNKKAFWLNLGEAQNLTFFPQGFQLIIF